MIKFVPSYFSTAFSYGMNNLFCRSPDYDNFGDVDMDPNNFDFNEVIDVRQLLQLGDEFLNVAPMPNQPNQPNF